MTSNPDSFELSKRRKALSILTTLLFLGAGGAVASENTVSKPIKKKPSPNGGKSSCLAYSYNGLGGSYTKQDYMQALDASIQALANSSGNATDEKLDAITQQVLILKTLRANFDI